MTSYTCHAGFAAPAKSCTSSVGPNWAPDASAGRPGSLASSCGEWRSGLRGPRKHPPPAMLSPFGKGSRNKHYETQFPNKAHLQNVNTKLAQEGGARRLFHGQGQLEGLLLASLHDLLPQLPLVLHALLAFSPLRLEPCTARTPNKPPLVHAPSLAKSPTKHRNTTRPCQPRAPVVTRCAAARFGGDAGRCGPPPTRVFVSTYGVRRKSQ